MIKKIKQKQYFKTQKERMYVQTYKKKNEQKSGHENHKNVGFGIELVCGEFEKVEPAKLGVFDDEDEAAETGADFWNESS